MRLNAATNGDLTRKQKVDLGGPKFGVLRWNISKLYPWRWVMKQDARKIYQSVLTGVMFAHNRTICSPVGGEIQSLDTFSGYD